ncbi:DUF1801 domain-containing protein [Streptosporangium sp. CA-135522]|uniref:DUF1801 domain-containing protein n=1 Tax=Streptosporangium sp. CA-135522 TaxID=3240072 RepID=UPI003D8E844A
MAKFANVDEYFAALAEPLREVGEKVRSVIDGALPGVEAALWHGDPTWSLGAAPGKAPVVFVKASAAYLTLGLWRIQEISDPSGRIQPMSRPGMGSVKLRSVADIDVELFTDWLRQARELEPAK